MDLVTGKLHEEDHRRLRAATLVDAADTLKALEDVERADSPAGASAGSDTLDRSRYGVAAVHRLYRSIS